MPGIESNAVEPTKDELRGLTPVAKALRLAPTYGLVLLMLGLIILFSGALAYMNRPWVERLYLRLTSAPVAEAPAHG